MPARSRICSAKPSSSRRRCASCSVRGCSAARWIRTARTSTSRPVPAASRGTGLGADADAHVSALGRQARFQDRGARLERHRRRSRRYLRARLIGFRGRERLRLAAHRRTGVHRLVRKMSVRLRQPLLTPRSRRSSSSPQIDDDINIELNPGRHRDGRLSFERRGWPAREQDRIRGTPAATCSSGIVVGAST